MTPQLKQAISLLQLSTLDLRQEIQQALDGNPLLDQEDEFSEQAATDTPEDGWADSIPNELSVDSDWSDTYQDTPRATGAEGPDFDRQAAGQSLHGHLLWQLAMLDLTADEHLIAEALIDAVDANGYLTQSLADVEDGAGCFEIWEQLSEHRDE
jgi:RNA polymerase sigma-54 factor